MNFIQNAKELLGEAQSSYRQNNQEKA